MKKLLHINPDKKFVVYICAKQKVEIQIFREFKDGSTCWDTKPFKTHTYVTEEQNMYLAKSAL